MGKWKQKIFGVTAAVICGFVLFTNGNTGQAAGENPTVEENLTFGEVYNTAVEEA